MDRKIFIEDEELALIQYTHEDDMDMYTCWLDKATQKGFNYIIDETFEEFFKTDISEFHFFSSIYDKLTKQIVGVVRLAPKKYEPDLAIWMFKPYRNKGYGKKSFLLGLKYCFNILKLEKVFVGCYENNVASLKLINGLGFSRNEKDDVKEVDVFTKQDIIQLGFSLTFDRFENMISLRA